MKYYISTYSSAATPNRVEICKGDGTVVRTLETNDALRAELAATQRPTNGILHLRHRARRTRSTPTSSGRAVSTPRGVNPVLLTQYSGPGSQTVADRWSLRLGRCVGRQGLYRRFGRRARHGFRGERFKKQTYGRLGAMETEDQLSLARHMAAQPWVDAGRIGIYGWSYGGFMALNCALKGHGLFKMAIAVAPVTSWRYYDTIYTEIYNNLPQYNAAGYDDHSPLRLARLLDDKRTRLLLIHGTADDNVHFQHTAEMARALNRAGKRYDMMVYPDQNHSMMPDDTANVRQKMIDYTLEHL